MTWNATDADNDTVYYTVTAGTFSQLSVVDNSTRNVASLGEINDNMIINWDIVAYDLFGGSASIGSPTVSFSTNNDVWSGSVVSTELKGESSAVLAVNESLNLWCKFNETSMAYWRLYKEGVLNRSGYSQEESEVFYAPNTVTSSDGYAVSSNTQFQAYVSGAGQGKVYAGSTLTFDSSSDVDIFEAKAYVGKYADAVVVFYRRLSDGYLREAVCTTSVCMSRVLIAQNVTAFRSYQPWSVPGELHYTYTVGTDDVYYDGGLVDSSGSQYVGTGTSGAYYYDTASQQVGAVSTPGLTQLVVAEINNVSGSYDVVLFTNASGGYMFSSDNSTVYKFADNVSALSAYGPSTGLLTIMYSNGVDTVYKVCRSTSSCGNEHVVVSGASSQTQLQEGFGEANQWLYSYTQGSSMSMVIGEASYYAPSVDYVVATVPSSELAVGQNWTGNCTPLSPGRYNVFPSGFSNKDVGTAVSSSTKTVQNTVNVVPVFVSFDPVNGSSQLSVNYTLSWVATDANFDPLTYDVYLGTNASNLLLVANDLVASNYSPVLTGHVVYYWKVLANDSFDIVDSGVLNFSTANRAPSLSTFSPASGSNVTTGLFSWAYADDDNDTVYFNVYHGNTSNPPLVSFGQLSTSYVPAVSANVTYFWRVVANDTRNLTNSSVFNYTTIIIPPNAPVNESPVNGTAGLTGVVTLLWNASDNQSNPLTYDVYVGTSPLLLSLVGDNQVLNSKSVSTNASTTYYWQVVVNNTAATTTGPIWQFSTVENSAPTTPGAVIWIDTTKTPAPEVAVNGLTNLPVVLPTYWASSSDANGDTVTYDLYLGFSEAGMVKVASQTANSRTWGLEPAKTYYVKVVANDSKGGINQGPTSSFSTRLNLTPTVSLTAPNNGATGLSQATGLSWSGTAPDGDSLSYDLYVGNASNNTVFVTTTSSSSYSYYGSLLTTYYWRVVARNGLGASGSSAVYSYTTAAAAAPAPTPPVINYPQSGTVTPNNPVIDWNPSQTNSSNTITYNVTITTPNSSVTIITNSTELDVSDVLNLTEDTPVNITITASDGVTSSDSTSTEFTTLIATSPGFPVLSQPQDPNSDLVFTPSTDPNTGNPAEGDMIVTNPSTGDTITVPIPTLPVLLDPGEYGCDPGQTCQFTFVVPPQNGDGGLNYTINITNPSGLQPGHNTMVSLKVTPSALIPQANISLGSIYGCASNPAQAVCNGESGVIVGNMYNEVVNGLNRTIQEFACYDPVTGSKIVDMTVAKSYCPYEIYAGDLNNDGTSEVVAFDGVYDLQRSIALKLFTGTKPYDFMVPLDVNGDGSMDFVYSKRAIDDVGVFVSQMPLGDGEVQIIRQRDQLLFGLDNCELRPRDLQYTAQIILENGELGESVLIDSLAPTNDPCNLGSQDEYAPGEYIVNWYATDPLTGSRTNGSTRFTKEAIELPDVSKCIIGVDGEFNYFESPRSHGWTVSSYGSEPVVDPAVDGAALYLTDGVVIEHPVSCVKSQFEVSTRVAPLDVVDYLMKLSLIGDVDGKQVVVSSLWIEDIDNEDGSNLFVYDRQCDNCIDGKRPVGVAPVSSKTGIAKLLINSNEYITEVGESIIVGDVTIKLTGIDEVDTSSGVKKRLSYSASNDYDSFKNSMYEGDAAVFQLSGLPDSNGDSTSESIDMSVMQLWVAGDIRFETIRLVADMNMRTVAVYVGAAIEPVATVGFVQEVDSLSAVRVESVYNDKTLNSFNLKGFAIDYLRTIGVGQAHKALTADQQRILESMRGSDSLEGCAVDAGLNFSHVGKYCWNLKSKGVTTSEVCGLDNLRLAVQYNANCFKESINYCTKYTYPKTQGFSDESLVNGDVQQQSTIEGISACTVALGGSQSANWVFMPIFYGLKTVVLKNITLLVIIALITMITFAYGRNRR
jgi:hypothetical protein